MKYVKAAIVLILMGFVVFVCFWPIYEDVEWLCKIFDPAAQAVLQVIGAFALIVMISVIFIIFLG